MNRQVRLVSWNVKRLNHPMQRRKVFSHLKQLKTEIVLFQETHISSSDNSHLLSNWLGQGFHSSVQAKARGVSILVNQDTSFELHNMISDKFGRFVIASGKLYNTPVVLVNVYAPNIDDVTFFEQVFSLLPDLNTYFLILGGDFNCRHDPVLDRSFTNLNAASRSACFYSGLPL